MESVVSIPRQILIQAILILINAFFAAAEIAVISLNHNKLKKQVEELTTQLTTNKLEQYELNN